MPSSASSRSSSHPHSFPTRRSSDLMRPIGPIRPIQGPRCRAPGPGYNAPSTSRSHPQPRPLGGQHAHLGSSRFLVRRPRPCVFPGPRSEEHTSELQSLRHLVCRLLLPPAPRRIPTLSLHDALPILCVPLVLSGPSKGLVAVPRARATMLPRQAGVIRNPGPSEVSMRTSAVRASLSAVLGLAFFLGLDRKSTRLNSSHLGTSYAVFCFLPLLVASPLFPYTTLFRSYASHWSYPAHPRASLPCPGPGLQCSLDKQESSATPAPRRSACAPRQFALPCPPSSALRFSWA